MKFVHENLSTQFDRVVFKTSFHFLGREVDRLSQMPAAKKLVSKVEKLTESEKDKLEIWIRRLSADFHSKRKAWSPVYENEFPEFAEAYCFLLDRMIFWKRDCPELRLPQFVDVIDPKDAVSVLNCLLKIERVVYKKDREQDFLDFLEYSVDKVLRLSNSYYWESSKQVVTPNQFGKYFEPMDELHAIVKLSSQNPMDPVERFWMDPSLNWNLHKLLSAL